MQVAWRATIGAVEHAAEELPASDRITLGDGEVLIEVTVHRVEIVRVPDDDDEAGVVRSGEDNRAVLDRELYLPQGWAADTDRRAEAGVPADVAFRTKPHLARVMLERALDAGVPAAWVTGDELYGGDRRVRLWLEARDVPHVFAVKRTEPLVAMTVRGPAQVPATDLVAALPAATWQCLSAGEGAKGPRLYAWARVAIRPLSDPERGYWVLVRRSLADPTDLAHYACYGPAEATLADLVRVAGMRWAIEEAIEAAKSEVGLDHDEVRRWDSWYRHITLCLLAHAFLVVTRAGVGGEKGAAPTADLLLLTVPEVRTLLCRLVWGRPPPPEHTLHWSIWRRQHQARAKRCHYQRRLTRRTEQLRL